MAFDHEQLKRSPAVSGGARAGMLFGLAVLMPVLAWVLAVLRQSPGIVPDGSTFTLNALRILGLALALSVPVSLPWFATGSDWNKTLFGPLTIVLIPLPLVTILWLTGDLRLMLLLQPLAGIAVIMLTLSVLLRLPAMAGFNFASVTLIQTAIIVVIAGLAWALRDEWLTWLGL